MLCAGESKVNPYDLFVMSSAMGRDGLDHRGLVSGRNDAASTAASEINELVVAKSQSSVWHANVKVLVHSASVVSSAHAHTSRL